MNFSGVGLKAMPASFIRLSTLLFCVCGDDEKLSVIPILRIPRISTILPRLES